MSNIDTAKERETPDRISVWPWNGRQNAGQWSINLTNHYQPVTEYVRADLLDARDAEIERLRFTLIRIRQASKFWAGDVSGSDAVRYAHESTQRLARAALNPEGET